jgi:hypothetical protein
VLADFQTGYDAFIAASAKAIKLSRKETVDGVEERGGSRTVYTKEVRPVLETLDGFHDQLEDRIAEQAAEQAERGDATAASGKRTVLHVVGLALLIAAGLAFVVTRSVTRPVAALADRLRSLNDHCLAGLTSGLEATAEGDLTNEVTPVTTPVEVKSRDDLGSCPRRSTRCSPRRSARSWPTTRCASSSVR